jgi:hypothetical protein
LATARHAYRIPSVDFFRGICLLMIFINHIPDNPLTNFTLRNYGFADSAEIFVFLAGFSATFAFGRYFQDGGFVCGVIRVGKRTWQLFCAHLLLVFALSAVVAYAGNFTDSKPIMEKLNFSPFFVETEVALVHLMKLQYMPNLTDILPLYIVLVGAFPLIWLAVKASPAVTLAVSFAVWLWANVTGQGFSNYPEGYTWFLNPLAWQFMFVSGAVAARNRDAISGIIRSKLLLAVSLAVVLTSLIATAPWVHFAPLAEVRIVPTRYLSIDDKTNLSIVRIIHFFAIAILALRLLPPESRFWRSTTSAVVSIIGRHALPVYCVGAIAALIADIFIAVSGANLAGILAIDCVGLLLLLGLAFALERGQFVLSAASAKIKAGGKTPAPPDRMQFSPAI